MGPGPTLAEGFTFAPVVFHLTAALLESSIDPENARHLENLG
jgi:hypothetical protein